MGEGQLVAALSPQVLPASLASWAPSLVPLIWDLLIVDQLKWRIWGLQEAGPALWQACELIGPTLTGTYVYVQLSIYFHFRTHFSQILPLTFLQNNANSI